MQWDAFISHASEDKDAVARPLSDRLQQAGLQVWLDEEQFLPGDSLREKIDQGLIGSRFAVVILSRSFLEKTWPKRELDGMLELEINGRHVILPVWHQLAKEDLLKYSAMLVGRFALTTEKGIDFVANKILECVYRDRGANIFDTYYPGDRRWFEEAVELFNRPAFRGKYIGWTGSEPFQTVVRRTLKALNTGSIENIDGSVRKTISSMTAIKDKKLFAAVLDVANRLKEMDNLIAGHASDYLGDSPDKIKKMNEERDEIVRRLNEIWQAFGIHTLPIPTSITTVTDAYGVGQNNEGTVV